MGRGHSGTTVLDSILGNGNEILSVGELISAMGNWEKRFCSCGDSVYKCPFWKQLVNNFENLQKRSWEKSSKILWEQANLSQLLKTLFISRSNSWTKSILKLNDDILNSIFKVSNGKSIIVDSSKEPTRAIFLSRFSSNAVIIHLVRHPEGVLSSYYDRIKRRNWPMTILRITYNPSKLIFTTMMIITLGWVVGNLLNEIPFIRSKKKCIRIRFEDISNNPVNELKKIENLIKSKLDNVVEKVENVSPMLIGHNIGGDDMRLISPFIFDKKANKRHNLPMIYRIMCRLLAWPLLLRYKYNIFRPNFIKLDNK
jgi:hypothetical protein